MVINAFALVVLASSNSIDCPKVILGETVLLLLVVEFALGRQGRIIAPDTLSIVVLLVLMMCQTHHSGRRRRQWRRVETEG